MARSYTEYEGDGVTMLYDISFPYLSKTHVVVFVNDILKSFTWVNAARVELLYSIPVIGDIIRIQRFTENNTFLVDFVDGNLLTENDLDVASLQNFYLTQESLDMVTLGVASGALQVNGGGGVTAVAVSAVLEEALSTSATIATIQGDVEGTSLALGDKVSVTQLAAVSDVVDIASAEYTLKVDVNGRVAGFGVSVVNGASGPSSEFAILADKFVIAQTDPLGALVTPFYIFNGITYIDTVMIADATIGDAHIDNLNAAKINAGYMEVARLEAGKMTVDKLKSNETFTQKLMLGDGNIIFDGPNKRIDIMEGAVVRARISSTEFTIRNTAGDIQFSSGAGVPWDQISGIGKAADGADVALPSLVGATNFGGSFVTNADMTMVSPDGRPAGAKSGYGAANPADISYLDANLNVLKLNSATNNQTGVGFPAFRVDPRQRYRIIVRVKANVGSGSGLYIGMCQHTAELGDGITHVMGNGGEAGVVSANAPSVWLRANGLVIDTYVEYAYVYTPAVGAIWASVVCLNWLDMGYTELHIDRVAVYPYVEQITAANASTYIANAAITTLQVKDAAITAAKIGTLAVDTIHIKGFAVNKSYLNSTTVKTLSLSTTTYDTAFHVRTAWQEIARLQPVTAAQGEFLIRAGGGIEVDHDESNIISMECRILVKGVQYKAVTFFSRPTNDILVGDRGLLVAPFYLEWLMPALSLSGASNNAVTLEVRMLGTLNNMPFGWKSSWASVVVNQQKV